jgi:hypothetical protein
MNGDRCRARKSGEPALRLLDLTVCVIGFGFCFIAYYPGMLSPDSISMMSQARDLSFTDWHSPVMPLLWAGLYRLAPGPQGMLALLLAFYWGAVFLLAGAAAQIERHVAPAMLIAGFMPFTINFAGTLWSDVLTATSWLICSALVFSVEIRRQPLSIMRQGAAWALFLIGGLARPNALFAAVPLGLYLWQSPGPTHKAKRALIAFLLLAGLWLAGWTISYPMLNAKKFYPIHSIVTFDLAGISHFSGRNYLPLQWNAEETAKIVSSCYTPQAWNEYAWGECSFVWRRLRDEGLWGSGELWRAWLDAVEAQPLAYLRHRSAHFWYFITADEYLFHEGNSAEEVRRRDEDNFGFKRLREYVLDMRWRFMFRPILWIALACACLIAARPCAPASRRFVSAVSLSSLVYLGTYFLVGVASNFRYAYWAVLATSACLVVLACEAAAALTRLQQRVVRASPQSSGS